MWFPLCKSKEGQGLGTITFPVGTRDVSSICRNSCKANSSLFFPAANPPYGVFSYTGDSCDGSETSEGSGSGETGGGETGGGETGGGETGGGETGGGETGGGETGGGETGGGETGGGETGGGNGEVLSQISSKLDGLATGVTDIGDLLKGVDTSKAGIDGTCIQGGTCQGFYESAYEGDLSTVVGGQLDSMKTSIVDPFVSSFGNIDLSGAQRPKFGLPVPFYGYMSFDDYIDMDWIFGFLRFIFLASTAFYCRQIIFGG
ncbi:hypothetical protein KLJ63_09205 [Vibrio splendidus]|nr:hypothetical protein KLJ63_09205 [Vibrio splendidus]